MAKIKKKKPADKLTISGTLTIKNLRGLMRLASTLDSTGLSVMNAGPGPTLADTMASIQAMLGGDVLTEGLSTDVGTNDMNTRHQGRVGRMSGPQVSEEDLDSMRHQNPVPSSGAEEVNSDGWIDGRPRLFINQIRKDGDGSVAMYGVATDSYALEELLGLRSDDELTEQPTLSKMLWKAVFALDDIESASVEEPGAAGDIATALRLASQARHTIKEALKLL